MKRLFPIIFSLFLILPCISKAADIQRSIQAVQQQSATVPAALYTVIKELNMEQFTTTLAAVGPLSKTEKALPLLELYKMRDSIQRGLEAVPFLLFYKAWNLERYPFLWVAAGGVGATVTLTAFLVEVLSKVNSSLLGAASVGAMVYGLYKVRQVTQQRSKEMDHIITVATELRKKGNIVDTMITMLEAHPEIAKN